MVGSGNDEPALHRPEIKRKKWAREISYRFPPPPPLKQTKSKLKGKEAIIVVGSGPGEGQDSRKRTSSGLGKTWYVDR